MVFWPLQSSSVTQNKSFIFHVMKLTFHTLYHSIDCIDLCIPVGMKATYFCGQNSVAKARLPVLIQSCSHLAQLFMFSQVSKTILATNVLIKRT